MELEAANKLKSKQKLTMDEPGYCFKIIPDNVLVPPKSGINFVIYANSSLFGDI